MAALLTLIAAAILFGGGSSFAFESERLGVRLAGSVMMLGGASAFVGAFVLALR